MIADPYAELNGNKLMLCIYFDFMNEPFMPLWITNQAIIKFLLKLFSSQRFAFEWLTDILIGSLFACFCL